MESTSKSGPPHEALFLVLAYLPVYELLTISRVCKSFRDALNSDVLPWLHFIVKRPLNSRLFDEALIKLTSKGNGRLRSLVLANCARITDDGLLMVIQDNPLINKLHLQGCTTITPNGIIKAAKTLHQNRTPLKTLRINGILYLNQYHLKTLLLYLHPNTPPQDPHPIPLLYQHYTASPSHFTESDRPIDVDVCPRCNEIKMVFECSKEHVNENCKGCNLCIPRCVECGGCVDNEELDEVACEDVLCRDCWLCLPKCNHCNKPYCKEHSDLECRSLGSAGFVCEACRFEAAENSST